MSSSHSDKQVSSNRIATNCRIIKDNIKVRNDSYTSESSKNNGQHGHNTKETDSTSPITKHLLTIKGYCPHVFSEDDCHVCIDRMKILKRGDDINTSATDPFSNISNSVASSSAITTVSVDTTSGLNNADPSNDDLTSAAAALGITIADASKFNHDSADESSHDFINAVTRAISNSLVYSSTATHNSSKPLAETLNNHPVAENSTNYIDIALGDLLIELVDPANVISENLLNRIAILLCFLNPAIGGRFNRILFPGAVTVNTTSTGITTSTFAGASDSGLYNSIANAPVAVDPFNGFAGSQASGTLNAFTGAPTAGQLTAFAGAPIAELFNAFASAPIAGQFNAFTGAPVAFNQFNAFAGAPIAGQFNAFTDASTAGTFNAFDNSQAAGQFNAFAGAPIAGQFDVFAGTASANPFGNSVYPAATILNNRTNSDFRSFGNLFNTGTAACNGAELLDADQS